MKGTLLRCLTVFACLAASPVGAGTLYKCTGADGVPAYVSKRVAGARCESVMQYRPGPSTRSAVPAAPVSQSAVSTAVPSVANAGGDGAVTPSPQKDQSVPAPSTGGSTPRTVRGQVYSYMKDGVRHYSSQRPAGQAGQVRTIAYSYIERCYACGTSNSVNFGKVRLRTDAYNAEIAAAAREFGVDEAIVRAVIHAESAFNPLAVSHAGAQGLMQLMPATARRFGVSDSFDAEQNIRGGVQYLAWLLRRFNGNLTLAAAGYNAGEGAVDRHGGVPPYRETQHYVQRVGQLVERYRSETRPAS